MATGISAFGERGISGTFGFENNELHRRVYLHDPAHQLEALLQSNSLFGAQPDALPGAFPPPFNTFRVFTVSFEADEKNVQGETETPGDFSLLQALPKFRGGLVVDITYRPMGQGGSANQYYPVMDEAWDFSAQTMSMIGNKYGSTTPPITYSDNDPVTNLQAIIKIVPKVEFVQRQVFLGHLPPDQILQLIGQVNDHDFPIGASGGGNTQTWPAGTALCTGIPTVRRWRFDGQEVFEAHIKLAINLLYGTTENGPGYVTWNRLYRPTKPGGAIWDTVYIGNNGDTMYKPGNLSQLTGNW